MEIKLDTPNPAHATIKKLLSDPVDVLLRPKGGWNAEALGRGGRDIDLQLQ